MEARLKAGLVATAWCAISTCTAAGAADLTVFGLELGKALTLPDCQYRLGPVSGKKFYSPVQPTTCVEDSYRSQGFVQVGRPVIFSDNEAPAIIRYSRLTVLEAGDGRLVGVSFYTNGLPAQDAALAQLQTKYGAPTTLTERTIRTATGGPFQTFDAMWDLPGLRVEFRGTVGQIDMGRVTIDLPDAAAIRSETQKNPAVRKL